MRIALALPFRFALRGIPAPSGAKAGEDYTAKLRRRKRFSIPSSIRVFSTKIPWLIDESILLTDASIGEEFSPRLGKHSVGSGG
jgi:hypothetical protein